MVSCGCSVLGLLLFVNQVVLVGLTQVWCCIAVSLLNLSLAIPLVSRCVFLQLTSNAGAGVNALIMLYYLTFNSITPLVFMGGICKLT